jgi:hypothetical protein
MARWVWGDHPDPDRLAAQLDQMLDAGFGGALIRPGAALPPGTYLGEAWFEAVAAVAKRARKHRASIWIAEDLDDPATQAVARGIIHDAPERAARMLVMDDVPIGSTPRAGGVHSEAIAAFEVTRESARDTDDRGGRTPQSLRALTAAGVDEVAPVRRLIFRLTTLDDRLSLYDAEATLSLLERTHQRYHLQARKYFGNTIGLCLMLGAHTPRMHCAVPWDPEAPALFQETHGYPLLANLPALFFDLPGYEAVRSDFWSLMDDMLHEGFTGPFVRWAAERGIPHACALQRANPLNGAVPSGGHAMARFAEHPFAAIVTDCERHGADIALREAQSIKRQLGKEGVLEIAPADQNRNRRWCAMERTTRGVNFIAERTVLDSLRGDRKFPAPSLVLLPNEDHPHIRAIFDAEARLAWMLGQGRTAAEVLVLHPYTSLQALYCAGATMESSTVQDAIARHFAGITRTLEDARIDFDYGDEAVLARHARAGQRALRVGQGEYRVVVMPPLLNLRSTTLGILHDFAITGGLVLAIGSLPELVDGRRSDHVLRFFEEYGERLAQGPDFGRYHALIDRLTQARVTQPLKDADSGLAPECIATQRRTWDEIEVRAFHNAADRAARVSLEFTAGVGGRAELWDPLWGTMQTLGATTPGEPLNQTITLGAGVSSLIVSVPEAPETRGPSPRLTDESRVTPPWTARRTTHNAVALSECRIVDGNAPMDWKAPSDVRNLLAGRIAQARGPVSLRTQWRFRVAAGSPPITDCAAILELSEGASIRLDGDEIAPERNAWVLDPSMREVSLPSLVPGEHLLELWRMYAAPGDLQPPWIRGPIADVTLKDEGVRIAAARDTIAVGALASQGLRSYFGEIVYTARMDGAPAVEGRRVELRLRGLSEPAEIRVDGSRAGFVLPPNTTCDLTEFWRPGTRSVEIVLRVPPDGLIAQLHDGRNAAPPHHGLPSPPELVTLMGR